MRFESPKCVCGRGFVPDTTGELPPNPHSWLFVGRTGDGKREKKEGERREREGRKERGRDGLMRLGQRLLPGAEGKGHVCP